MSEVIGGAGIIRGSIGDVGTKYEGRQWLPGMYCKVLGTVLDLLTN